MSLPFEPRIEDHRLLTGAGRFLDDERMAGAAHAVFVRSPHAFATIRGIDTAEARRQPGVLSVLTAGDMERAGVGNVAVVGPIPNGAGLVVPLRPALAGDCARHVGDAVALVVAESDAAARDAAELVATDYEPRDPVTDVARAVAPNAPQIWPEAPGNIALDWPGFPRMTNRDELARIFAGAAHVARLRLVNQRIVMAPMEPRGALAEYDAAANRFVLHSASQSAVALRQNIAQTLGVAPDRVRILSGDVGGAFGMRTAGYPEYPALLIAAKELGRPVHWLSTRSEGFVSDNQARDTILEAALALDEAGRFLALDIDVVANMGAYLTQVGAFIATVNFARCFPCMYDVPQIGLRIRCVFTNTVPTGPYRGAGRPEANYCVERLVDAAARRSGIDRLGLGVSCFLEIAGGQPGEGAGIAFPGQSKLLLAIGVQASGQGRRTLYRRLAAERLGIPAEAIEVEHGDSDDGVPSFGAVASRSTMSVGSAVVAAIDAVIEKGRRIAAHVLEAAEADIAYRDGVFEIAGTDRRVPLFELAERARALVREGISPEDLDTRRTAEASRRASARRSSKAAFTTMPAASCWPARSWITRCRAPRICRISRAVCARCRAAPTRSASKASGRPVRRRRSPRS